MGEPVTTATVVKAGAMMASGGMMADIVLFQDKAYMYLAVVGAITSMFGVLHDVFSEDSKAYTKMQIMVEAIKGLLLGILAIPMWYLVITEGVLSHLLGYKDMSISNSLALIASFGASWYTVPIFDGVVKRVFGGRE